MTLRSTSTSRSTRVLMALLAAPALLLGLLAGNAGAVEEVYVYHLLVRSRAEAEKALEEVVNTGITRENFITVARKYSMDHPTKGSGGDLGWNSRRKFVREFADAAFDLEVGQISEPVRTQYGWHVIYLRDKRDLQAESSAQGGQTSPPTPPPTPPARDPHAGHDHGKTTPTIPTPVGDQPAATAPSTPTAPVVTTPDAPAGAGESTTTPDVSRPAPPPAPVARPVAVNLPARRLTLSLESGRRNVRPTVGLDVSLTLANEGSETLKVFHPDLLPLGLSVRTDTTPEKPPASWEAVPEPEAVVIDLRSRGIVGATCTINDYFKDLPADCRLWISWDPDQFAANFDARFPGKRQSVAEFESALASFPAERGEFRKDLKGLPDHNRYVFTRTSELPAAIFDFVRPQGKYFLKLTLQRESGPVWFELFNEAQIQGVRHFANLVNDGFYDGLRLFDIQKGDYIQGGCPKNDGTGGPPRGGYFANSGKVSHQKGVLSLITRLRPQGRGREAGSIFFICRKDHTEFDEIHVPIGKLIQGEETLERIESRSWVTIETASIVTEARAPADVLAAATGELVASTPPDGGTAATSPTTPPATLTTADGARIVGAPALPRAVIETSKGTLTVELYEDDARNTVANFIDLAEQGFYSADAATGKAPLTFFDSHPDYYVRAGSPDGSEGGGPGYQIRSELTNNTRRHEKGTLSMCLEINAANGQPIPNTAGSQFFICRDAVPYWNGIYTPFGKVIGGLDVLANLQKGDTITSVKVIQKRAGLYKPAMTKKQ